MGNAVYKCTHLCRKTDFLNPRHTSPSMLDVRGLQEDVFLVDSCQDCFGSSVWILCQMSLLSAVVEFLEEAGIGIAPGGLFESAAMRWVLNRGDRYTPPAGILLPSQRPLVGVYLRALR